jgi:hypothetical protein
MLAVETISSIAQLGFRLLVECVDFPLGMVEEGVSDEVVFRTVVTTHEYERERPNNLLCIGLGQAISVFVYKGSGLIVPSTEVRTEPPIRFLRELDEDGFDADFNGCTFLIQIAAAVKVVFIDDWAAK